MHVYENKMVKAGLFFVRIVELGVFAPPKLSPVGFVSMTHRTSEFAYFRFVVSCSTNTSVQCCALNSRMNRGSLELSLRIPMAYKQESSLPKFTRYAQVLAAPHESIALT